MASFWLIIATALGAALASLIGGIVATFLPRSSLLLSVAVGFAAGTLLGTLAFEMLPTSLENLLPIQVAGATALGAALTYTLDLWINRGRLAGPDADQLPSVERHHRRHRPFGTQLTVLAAATSTEELIEGVTIGVGSAIGPTTALLVGLAIGIDNVSEALSIGSLARKENEKTARRRTIVWTSTIGASLFASAMVGWFALRGLPEWALASLLAVGAGAMFYLTVTDLLPEAEQHQFQQSAALAALAGLLLAFLLAQIS